MFDLLKGLFGGGTSSQEIKDAVANGAFLVDVRTPGEFATGSAKGAINIPLDKLPSQIAKFKNKKSVVVFCRSGARSSQAKTILTNAGISPVINGGGVDSVISAIG